jgi:fructose-bisphosphate aldolase class II
VGKVNVNTENQVVCTEVVRQILNEQQDLIDPRKYLDPAREAMKDIIKQKIRLFGSAIKFNKAWIFISVMCYNCY